MRQRKETEEKAERLRERERTEKREGERERRFYPSLPSILQQSISHGTPSVNCAESSGCQCICMVPLVFGTHHKRRYLICLPPARFPFLAFSPFLLQMAWGLTSRSDHKENDYFYTGCNEERLLCGGIYT